MATATLSYTGPADGQPSVALTHIGSVSDALTPYFFAYYRTVYGSYFDASSGKVTTSAKAKDGTDNVPATDAQIFEAYAQGIASGTAAQVQRFTEQQAMQAALAQVQAIEIQQTQ